MVFSSLEFIFIFLPIFFLLYVISPNIKIKNLVILLGSLIFYGMGVWDSPIYIPLFIQTIIVNYIIGRLIQISRNPHKKNLLLTGIVYNVIWLLFFKYSGFFCSNINHLLHTAIPERNILLPIGISFYTFQNLSYLVDVYRKDTRASESLIDYGAYISMFPQLIAGPIVTYSTVARELKQRTHSLNALDKGLRIFTAGLGYKVLIANQIGGLWNDIHKIGYESISTPLAWLGIIAYSFQLYFDFYGYSMMAIGLGLMMGFHLPQNFDNPYASLTMTEFWRRWHMTLGTWFKDYIYFPLGGNRKGTFKMIRNMLIVWTLTGFWHGASWNFILWGLVLFFILMIEKLAIGKFMNQHKLIGHFYMFLLIPLSWTLFAITDMHSIGVYFSKLFPFLPSETTGRVMAGDYLKSLGIYWKYFLASIICCTPIPKILGKKFRKQPLVSAIFLLIVFICCIYCMYRGLNDPFLYFRF